MVPVMFVLCVGSCMATRCFFCFFVFFCDCFCVWVCVLSFLYFLHLVEFVWLCGHLFEEEWDAGCLFVYFFVFVCGL